MRLWTRSFSSCGQLSSTICWEAVFPSGSGITISRRVFHAPFPGQPHFKSKELLCRFSHQGSVYVSVLPLVSELLGDSSLGPITVSPTVCPALLHTLISKYEVKLNGSLHQRAWWRILYRMPPYWTELREIQNTRQASPQVSSKLHSRMDVSVLGIWYNHHCFHHQDE